MGDLATSIQAGPRCPASGHLDCGLHLLANALPALIAVLDNELVYRFANQAYEAWFGIEPERVVGRHIEDVISADAFAARQGGLERALAGERVQFELAWRHPDGLNRQAEIRYIPRRDASGAFDGLYVFAVDVTDRSSPSDIVERRVAERTEALRAEMAERERVEEARRRERKMEEVGELAGGIAHDFNNMLTGVISALELMKRRIASGRTSDLDRFIEAAIGSAQRAASINQGLLAFSRRQLLDPRPIDVNALVVSMAQQLRGALGDQIDLAIDIATSPMIAMADANQLGNSLLGLAVNARDAMPDGGMLAIATQAFRVRGALAESVGELAPGDYVMIVIDDTGIGMTAEVLERAFDPFFTTKPFGQGSGMGLSMIYGFAKQSGGLIQVGSRSGRGSTARLYLPVAIAASRSA